MSVLIGCSMSIAFLKTWTVTVRASLWLLVLVASALGLVTVVFSAAALLVFRGGDASAGFDSHTRGYWDPGPLNLQSWYSQLLYKRDEPWLLAQIIQFGIADRNHSHYT